MTTIVDLDTGQVLEIVDGRDSEGVGDWLFARPLQWRLGVQVVAIDPSAAFRKALRMWLPRTAVSVDAFHLVKLGNDMLTEVRQRLTQQVHGRRGRSIDPVWANRRLLLRAGDTLSDRAGSRLSTVFATDDLTGKLQAAWLVKEQLRTLLATGSLADAAAAKDRLQALVGRAAQPETNRLWRTVCRWWKEIEVLIVTGRDNSESGSQQHRDQAHKKNRPGIHQCPQLQNAYPVAQCRQNSGINIPHGRTFTTNREEPERLSKALLFRCESKRGLGAFVRQVGRSTSALLDTAGLRFLMELNPIISIVGTVVSVVALVATYGFHREIHPKRRLTYRIAVNPLMPNEANGGDGLKVSYSGITVEHPFLVTVTLRSQGKADIQSTSFAAQAPIRFDLNAPTYGPLGTPFGRSAHDVPVSVDGPSIGIGPAQLKKDFYLKFKCLCNGPPQVVARNCLTDIDLVDVSVKERKLAPLHRKLGRAFKWSWYELIAVTVAFFLLAVVMLVWPATMPFVNSQMVPFTFGWVFFVFGWALGFIGVIMSAVGFIVTLMPMRIIAMHDKMPNGLQPALAP